MLSRRTPRRASRGRGHARQRLALDWLKASTSRCSRWRRLGAIRVRLFPRHLVSFFRADFEAVNPTLNLRWLLLDFGRRKNAWDAAKEQLLAANLGFNRKHQEIIFQRSTRIFRANQPSSKNRGCPEFRRFCPRSPRVGGSAIAQRAGDPPGCFSRPAAGSTGRLRSGGSACD